MNKLLLTKLAVAAFAVTALAGFGLMTSGAYALSDSATILFGTKDVGSPFPANSGHDRSSNAKDNLFPRTVVIAEGGTVTFESGGVHQVAIFGPDSGVTKPSDVDTTNTMAGGAGCPPVPLIDAADQGGVVLAAQPCAGGAATLEETFDEPGKYLVICTFLPHFAEFQQYGWVVVK